MDRTRSSRIGRALRETGSSAVLLNVGTVDGADFRDEFALLGTLHAPGLIRPLELSAWGPLPAMELEDRDVVSLVDALDAPPFEVGAALHHRAGFYHLGLLLDRLLAGRLPFDAADPLEWVHCHTARMPVPLGTLAPQVPAPVALPGGDRPNV